MPTRPDSSDTAGLPSRPAPAMRPLWRRWLGEPLVHFLLMGMALCAIWRVLNPIPASDLRPNGITLTQDDLAQIGFAWVAQGRPAPTPEQMRHLIEARVREEILYREALALGLDKGDTIVRR